MREENKDQNLILDSGNHFQNARTANWSVLPRPEPETDVVIINKNSTWLTKGTKHVVTNNCGGCNVLLTLPPPPLICCREPVSKTWLSSYLHNLGISWENSWDVSGWRRWQWVQASPLSRTAVTPDTPCPPQVWILNPIHLDADLSPRSVIPSPSQWHHLQEPHGGRLRVVFPSRGVPHQQGLSVISRRLKDVQDIYN